MALRTNLTDADVAATLHAAQHNLANTAIVAMQTEGYWANASAQQVLLDGNQNNLTPLAVDTSASAVGSGFTYSAPSLTFVGAGVRMVTLFANIGDGTDTGRATGGYISLASSGDFTDPCQSIVPSGSSTPTRATLTIRRHFSDGETLTPVANLTGADATKHAAIYVTMFVVG